MLRKRQVETMKNHKEEILQKVEAFVVDAMGVNDPAHDGDHIKRVVTLTRKLLTFYPQANAFRTELLAWLHDMQDDKLAVQAETSSLADRLQAIGAEKEDIDFVLSAIPYISYRKHPKLPEGTPIEICIVQDADRLDAMGAIGIARTFAYGGAKGRPLLESLAHFEEKLLLLYDLLSTPEARELAKPRLALLQEFYHQYKEETK
jgi:uncharacterized protein